MRGTMEDGEPLTPVGRLFLFRRNYIILNCAIGLKNPIDIQEFKDLISNSALVNIPRFSSLLVLDPNDKKAPHWRKTQIDIDNHVFIHRDHDDHGSFSEEDMINSYLADMAISPPMSLDKPLWELHVLPGRKCFIMRVHHALADGTSFMSLLRSMGMPSSSSSTHDSGVENKEISGVDNNKWRRSLRGMGFVEGLLFIWFSVVFGLKILARILCVKDKGKGICGIEGVELWPRKVATARFTLDDMKFIKKSIPNATIFDVLYGVWWCGFTRYLSIRCPQAFQQGAQITGLCPVNMRELPGLQDLSTMLSENSRTPWGNKVSYILMPMIYNTEQCELDPLSYVVKAKSVMDQKKQSMEALFSYYCGTQCVSSKVASFLMDRMVQNTTFLISNIVGPEEEISLAGNPVTLIRLTSSSLAQAMTMHMVSYAGRADLQIQVAKEVIPDPEFLAKCLENALLDMKTSTIKIIANNQACMQPK